MGRRQKDAAGKESRAKEIAEMFDQAPTKRQRKLPFALVAPGDRATGLEAEHLAHKQAVATKQVAKADLAAAWGLPWPEPSAPSRKGQPKASQGPAKRQAKACQR